MGCFTAIVRSVVQGLLGELTRCLMSVIGFLIALLLLWLVFGR